MGEAEQLDGEIGISSLRRLGPLNCRIVLRFPHIGNCSSKSPLEESVGTPFILPDQSAPPAAATAVVDIDL